MIWSLTSVACEAVLLVGVYMAGAYQGGQATQQAINDAKTAINGKSAINGPINATGLNVGP